MAKHFGLEGITGDAALLRRARVVLGAAFVAATAILAAGWPAETHADGLYETLEQEQADRDDLFATGATEHGSLVAVSRIVPDQKRPGRYFLEILVRNKTGEGTECAEIEACLERTAYSPMARGAPPPSVVWKTKETTCAPAGQTVAKRIAIPAGLGAKIARAQRPPRQNDVGMLVGPVVEFSSNILQMQPPPAGAPATPNPASGTAKALAGSEPAGGESKPVAASEPMAREAKSIVASVVPLRRGAKPAPDSEIW